MTYWPLCCGDHYVYVPVGWQRLAHCNQCCTCPRTHGEIGAGPLK